jgi:large subunit ribosomal protein L30
MNENTITVTQIKSGAHGKPKTRGTLRALGLGRIGKSNTLPDRPEIRGMLRRVPHLVTVSGEGTQPDVATEEAKPRETKPQETEQGTD